ncbi:MAG: hypothetical protein HOW73_47420 [Polyangiaceae bacterium]|nr:hypothetical protein [Polyangiaceae bacterium]
MRCAFFFTTTMAMFGSLAACGDDARTDGPSGGSGGSGGGGSQGGSSAQGGNVCVEEIGCLAPSDCADGTLCDRLSGTCVDQAGRCGAPPSVSGGTLESGTGCLVQPDPQPEYTCAEGYVCTRGGPFPMRQNVVEGAWMGFCRAACDPCSDGGCPDGEACMLAGDHGGACFPLARAIGNQPCARVACTPGYACIGTFIGPPTTLSDAQCEMPCDADHPCPSELVCGGFLDGNFCRGGSLVHAVGDLCDSEFVFCDGAADLACVVRVENGEFVGRCEM